MSDLEQELMELERAFWERAGDVMFYEERLTEDAVMVFPAPFGVMDRTAILEAVATAAPWQDVELTETTVVSLGDDAAALAYRARAIRAGNPPYETYAGSAYARRAGTWLLALHQQTPIAEGS